MAGTDPVFLVGVGKIGAIAGWIDKILLLEQLGLIKSFARVGKNGIFNIVP